MDDYTLQNQILFFKKQSFTVLFLFNAAVVMVSLTVVLPVNPSRQLSTTQLLARPPHSGWERQLDG